MTNLFCKNCLYPLMFDFATDKAYCLICDAKIKRKLTARINWGKKTDEEVIQIWQLVAQYAPNCLWEVEAELLSRPSVRALIESEMAESEIINTPPSPIIDIKIPFWLRRFLPLISRQWRQSRGRGWIE